MTVQKGGWDYFQVGKGTDSNGIEIPKVVAEVTSMPEGPYVVEQGRYSTCFAQGTSNTYANGVSAGTSTPIAGTGARAGDYLHGILFTQGMTVEMSGVIIRDSTDGTNNEFSFDIKPQPGGGGTAAGVSALNAATDNLYCIQPGTFIPVGLTAKNGWMLRQTNGTVDVVGVVLIGRFSSGV